MRGINSLDLSGCAVFFDFDNTIATVDVLDGIIERFSINNDWIKLEKAWKKGDIGSRACLQGQLSNVRITKKELSRYLCGIGIDPHFPRLINLFAKEGIKPVILSDNFKFIINCILRYNGINGIKVHANELGFRGDRLLLKFPHSNKKCLRCAHCKKKHLLKKNIKDKIIIYIGDGLSDVCPAESSHIVFAKKTLLEHMKKTNKPFLAYQDLRDVEGCLRRYKNG